MSFRYLLDSNIVSHLVRHAQGPVAKHITRVGEQAICISIVVAAELRYDSEKSQSRTLAERIELFRSALEILPPEPLADRHYGALRHHLTQKGNVIGPNDLFIAAHALAADLTLVAANTPEFSRVPGLSIENWLAD